MKDKAVPFFLFTAVLCALLISGCAFNKKTPLADEPVGFSSIEETPQLDGAPKEMLEASRETMILPEPSENILELREENPDAVGILRIEGTRIDYPVVRGEDNEYYLTHSFEKTLDNHGAIFLDAALPKDGLTRHTVLHGHNMNDGSMFHDLDMFKGEEFLANHMTFTYETLYYSTKWQVFSVYVASSSESIPISFETDEEFIEYAQSVARRSLFPTDEEFTPNDILITLNTCSYEFSDAHTLVCAKLTEIID